MIADPPIPPAPEEFLRTANRCYGFLLAARRILTTNERASQCVDCHCGHFQRSNHTP